MFGDVPAWTATPPTPLTTFTAVTGCVTVLSEVVWCTAGDVEVQATSSATGRASATSTRAILIARVSCSGTATRSTRLLSASCQAVHGSMRRKARGRRTTRGHVHRPRRADLAVGDPDAGTQRGGRFVLRQQPRLLRSGDDLRHGVRRVVHPQGARPGERPGT